MNKNTKVVVEEVVIQSWLRPALTPVGANKDYEQFRDQIDTVDTLLGQSHLEAMALDFAVVGFEGADARQLAARKRFALKALRLEALRMLLGNPAFREFSRMIASCDLLADFCGARQIDGIKGVSKSVLDRASKFFSPEQVRWMHQVVLEMCGDSDRASEVGLGAPIQTEVCLVDATCLEANIHFPTDWVLLRDVSTTLLKAVKLIRAAGLRCRMPCEPAGLGRQMNRLCIRMSNAPRRRDTCRKERKKILRTMKRLLGTVAGHARRHRDRLAAEYSRTKYSQAQAALIVERIDTKLGQLPQVVEQACERIIGERQVQDAKKLLSVHEPQVHVLVRNKAGRKAEFGNTLLLAESEQGVILDWQLYRERAPSETQQLQESIARQKHFDLPEALAAACTDRGFNSREGSRQLRQAGIYDATCPRDPVELKKRLEEPVFARLQKRRSGTEARIAILNQRRGGVLRARGFEHRYLAMAWGVLGHNLWMVARMLAAQRKLEEAA